MFSQHVSELLAKYSEAAAGTAETTPNIQNKWADILHECYKSLCKSEEGRRGIIVLMNDGNPNVRLWAASHSLQWTPEAASKVLENLRDAVGFPCSFNAEITLEEFQKGSLSFDY
jgi:hypothetical protein